MSDSEVTFREAARADLPVILRLIADDPLGRTRETVSEAVAPAYVAAFDAMATDPNQLLTVAELRGDVVGCMQITYIPGLARGGSWRGQLENIRVAEPLRGQGVGEAYLRWAIALCKARGCSLVQLTTDRTRVRALPFYERLGFVNSHNGMKMRLPLGG